MLFVIANWTWVCCKNIGSTAKENWRRNFFSKLSRFLSFPKSCCAKHYSKHAIKWSIVALELWCRIFPFALGAMVDEWIVLPCKIPLFLFTLIALQVLLLFLHDDLCLNFQWCSLILNHVFLLLPIEHFCCY